MIIARSIKDDGELLLLGITRRNVEELMKGHPIRVTTETHGAGVPLGWTIAIVFGETEASIAADLRKAGAVGDSTNVMAMPRKPDHPPSKQ